MLDERLGQVEKLLSRYREQLYGKELAFGKAPDEDKARIKLQISDLKEEMQPYIQEYWDILSSQSTNIDISEEEAEIAVAEIVKNTNTIELAPSSYSSDVLYLLREIRDKLNQSEESAVTKVKGVLSSFPPFVAVSYEAELDLEKFLKNNFPTFMQLIKKTSKKKQFL